jgi:enoyl-CoA hydratase/carnithine racemase
VPVEEAHAMGLVDLVCSADQIHEEVQAYASLLAQKPAKALAAIRHTIKGGEAAPLDEGLKIEFESALKLARTKDFSEGISAFMEKRKPVWA